MYMSITNGHVLEGGSGQVEVNGGKLDIYNTLNNKG